MKDKGSRIQRLRGWADLLDSAFRVPGTNFRFGLDPLVGLIPGVGDLVSPVFVVVIIWHAAALHVPKVVIARMAINAIIDGVVGAVPIVGDAFDFVWRANDWNMALLERHATPGRRPSSGDYLFVILSVATVIVAAVIPVLLAVVFFYWLGTLLAK